MFVQSTLYAIIWAFLILILSLVSGSQLPKADILSFDKILHLLFYMILSLLLVYGLKRQYRFNKIRYNSYWYTLILCTIYGFLIEYMQPIISDRIASFSDFLANFIGSAIGLIAFRLIYKI